MCKVIGSANRNCLPELSKKVLCLQLLYLRFTAAAPCSFCQGLALHTLHSWNPPRNTGPLIFSVVPECCSDFCCSAVMFLSQARSELFCSCEFCCVTWAQSNQSGLSFVVFCHCAKWPLLRMGGRRCRTHVASLSKSDTACPSYA